MHRKSGGTDCCISKEKRKQGKANLKKIMSICHWSQRQFANTLSRSRLSAKGGAGPSAACAIHISTQKDCFSQTIVA